MDTQSICSNIRQIRLTLKKNQEEMADLLNIGRCTYINLEKGRTATVSGYVYKIARLAGQTPEQVLFGEGFTDTFLHECADFDETVKTLKSQYQKELDEKDAEISALKALVEAQNQTIASEREAIESHKQMNNILQGRIDMLERQKTIDIENNI